MITEFKKKEKRSRRSKFLNIFLVFLSLIIISFLAITNIKISERRKILISKINELEKEIQFLEEKNKKLEADISNFETSYYLEKIAREQFNLKKPEEEVVIISKNNKDQKKEQNNEENNNENNNEKENRKILLDILNLWNAIKSKFQL
ncbi:MAG: cell division protein FtsL [Candidatus Pacebacteria bacterium]|nr:cell division protein FtsL [Candidatus Paceibacterota bacterium]